MGLSENSRLFQIWRWGPNSYLIKLMEALDWVLSQIKMADRGVGLQRVSSVMIKVVGDEPGAGISESYYVECTEDPSHMTSIK